MTYLVDDLSWTVYLRGMSEEGGGEGGRKSGGDREKQEPHTLDVGK